MVMTGAEQQLRGDPEGSELQYSTELPAQAHSYMFSSVSVSPAWKKSGRGRGHANPRLKGMWFDS